MIKFTIVWGYTVGMSLKFYRGVSFSLYISKFKRNA